MRYGVAAGLPNRCAKVVDVCLCPQKKQRGQGKQVIKVLLHMKS